MATVVERCDFGGMSAEDDRRLFEYFVETPEFKAFHGGEKWLLLGEKGCGKTAIAKYVSHLVQPPSFALDLSPDTYLWRAIQSYVEKGIPVEMARKLAWKLTFIQFIAHFIVFSVQDLRESLPAQALRKFLVDNGLWVHEKTFWEKIRTLGSGSISFSPETLGLVLSKLGSMAEQNNAPMAAQIESSKSLVAQFLETYPGKVLVYIDRLDEFWDGSDAARGVLVGLLLAAREMNVLSSKLTVGILMRSDIYRSLRFADKDKFPGVTVEIRWSAEKLRSLLLRRIRVSLGLADGDEGRDPFLMVFPAAVVDSQRRGQPRDTFSFISSIITNRPRDLLIFCSEAKDLAMERGHAVIAAEDVVDAEAEFSHIKKDNTISEHAAAFPEISTVLDGLVGRPKTFGRQSFITAVNVILAKAHLKADEVIRKLIECEVVGVRVNERTYYYSSRTSIVDLIHGSNTRFVIHRCLARALALEGFDEEA